MEARWNVQNWLGAVPPCVPVTHLFLLYAGAVSAFAAPDESGQYSVTRHAAIFLPVVLYSGWSLGCSPSAIFRSNCTMLEPGSSPRSARLKNSADSLSHAPCFTETGSVD